MAILERHFGADALDVLEASPLLGYLNSKTRSANRGSKSRGSFANHYAMYVVIKDYLSKGYLEADSERLYSKYEGARFTDLMTAQRLLPFGSKLQNHGLNSRLNDEFRKFYPTLGKPVIVRDVETQRYWIQEDLLLVPVRRKDGTDVVCNIAAAVIEIIDTYAQAKRVAFEEFLLACNRISSLGEAEHQTAIRFITEQLAPTVDARVFEIVSYAILKARYAGETVWFGATREGVTEESLVLYKTGRTNANDGAAILSGSITGRSPIRDPISGSESGSNLAFRGSDSFKKLCILPQTPRKRMGSTSSWCDKRTHLELLTTVESTL